MKVVKSTGLVPVRDARRGGEPFGVLPAQAHVGLITGEFTLLSDDEMAQAESNGVVYEEVTDLVNVPAAAAPKDDGGLVIPENWETELHHLQRIKLAKQIDAKHAPEGEETKTEAADRIIRAELERRNGGEPDAVATILAPAGGGEAGTSNFTPAPDQAPAPVGHATNVGPVGGEAGTANVTPASPTDPITGATGGDAAPALTTGDVSKTTAPAEAAAAAKPTTTTSESGKASAAKAASAPAEKK